MSFLPRAPLHMCHFCQGCFPTQAALGLHLIDHNKLRALEAGQAGTFQPPPPEPAVAPNPAPVAAPVEVQASAFLPPLPVTPSIAFNAPPVPAPLAVAAQPSVLPPLPPPLPLAPVVASKAPPVPAAAPVDLARGVVISYNAKRCFGSIKRAVPSDKVHFYLSACNFQTPLPTVGEKVFFAEKQGPRGAIATSVVRTPGNTTALSESSDAPLVSGTVKHYQVLGGFGTIVTDDGAELQFRGHSCDVLRPPPTVGERVEVKQGVGSKGPIASVVRRVSVQAEAEPKKGKPKPKAASTHTTKVSAAKLTSSVTQGERIAEQTREMLQEVPSIFDGGKHPRYVYVDLDNIWVSFARAEHIVGKYPGAASTRDLVLHLEGLSRRLAAGEPSSSVARLVAFYFKTPAAIANGLRKFSHDGVTWEVRKQETVSDTTMQLELLNAKRPCEAHPRTLVLVTGDGNIAPNGMCFREILDQYLRDGWFVEVHAWLATMARSYIEFQREYSSTVVIRPLDDDLDQIVMLRKAYDARASRANAASSNTTRDGDSTSLVPGIVTKYEVLGGFGTIAKLDGSGGDLHFKIQYCDIKRPPPSVGERVMLTEGVSKKWGPCTSMVRRVSIEVDSDDAALEESKPEPVTALDNVVETKAAYTTHESEALGAAPVSQVELSAALARAIDMMVVDPNSATISNSDQQQAAQPSHAPAPVNADEYEDMIRLLSVPEEGEMYLASAIAMLEHTHPEEAATIQEMDPATQRILLLNILQDEVDSVQFDDLAAENPNGAAFDLEHDNSAPPSSPVDTSKQPADNGSPLMHPDPEPEPSRVMRCEKCTDDVPIDDMVLVSGCDHAFCRNCLRNYAVNRIDQEDVKPECPRKGCAFVLSDVDLARVLSIEEQKKYYDTRIQLAVGSASEAFTSL